MTQITFELPEDLMREIGPYQGPIQELVLLGLAQLKAQEVLTLYTCGIVRAASSHLPASRDGRSHAS